MRISIHLKDLPDLFLPLSINLPDLEKSNPDKICLLLREMVLLGPTLLLKVGHDVAPGDGFGLKVEKGLGL